MIRFRRRRWSGALLILGAGCVSCTELRLAPYRDERFLEQYRYALGEQYLEVEGLKLCYQEKGQGEPVLILPGLGTSIDFWQLVIPSIAQKYHVVAVDLPGFGKSDKPDAAYDLLWISERIRAFMDAKGLARASIIGGSLGGHLALLLALDHPERVAKLVLMGSSGTWPRPGPLLDLALKSLWNDAIVTDHLRRAWPDIFAKMSESRTPLTQTLLRYQMAIRANAKRFAPEGRAASRALRSIFYSSCRDRLPEVAVPVLLIWGEADQIHPPAEGVYFRKHLPDSRLVGVPGSRHEVMIDQPAVFIQAVLAFLERGTQAVPDGFARP